MILYLVGALYISGFFWLDICVIFCRSFFSIFSDFTVFGFRNECKCNLGWAPICSPSRSFPQPFRWWSRWNRRSGRSPPRRRTSGPTTATGAGGPRSQMAKGSRKLFIASWEKSRWRGINKISGPRWQPVIPSNLIVDRNSFSTYLFCFVTHLNSFFYWKSDNSRAVGVLFFGFFVC